MACGWASLPVVSVGPAAGRWDFSRWPWAHRDSEWCPRARSRRGPRQIAPGLLPRAPRPGQSSPVSAATWGEGLW